MPSLYMGASVSWPTLRAGFGSYPNPVKHPEPQNSVST